MYLLVILATTVRKRHDGEDHHHDDDQSEHCQNENSTGHAREVRWEPFVSQ